MIKNAIWTPLIENTRDELSRLDKSTEQFSAHASKLLDKSTEQFSAHASKLLDKSTEQFSAHASKFL